MTTEASPILLLWDRMGEYHLARWRALQKATPAQVFAADFLVSDQMYGWKSLNVEGHYRFAVDEQGRPRSALMACVRCIREKNIQTVCIPGYGRLSYVLLILLCWLMGRKVLLFAESWYPGHPWKDAFKGAFLRTFVHGYLVSGVRARDHFRDRLRIPEERMRMGYSVVDNAHFASIPRKPDPRTLLCVARFTPEKNLLALVEAFDGSRLPEEGWRLKLVGGGPLVDRLKNWAGSTDSGELMDWVSYQDMPQLFATATACILPSTFEPWGLVVNEAMAVGCPVLVCDQVGAAPDLITPETGWVFELHPTCDIRKALNIMAETLPEEREAMGQRGKERIQGFSCEIWAQHLLALEAQT